MGGILLEVAKQDSANCCASTCASSTKILCVAAGLESSLTRRGLEPNSERQREYTHTVVLAMGSSEAEVRKSFSTRLRSGMRKALETPLLRYAPIGGRVCQSHARAASSHFRAHGRKSPRLDARAILRDSSDGQSSKLVGAFATTAVPRRTSSRSPGPRLHGDYAVLEVTASERSALFRKHISPGFGLMAHLVAWAIEHGALWMDLGGLPAMDPEPSDPMRGVVEFKTRFSMDFREVATEWRLEPHPLLARAAAAVRSIRDFCEPRHAQPAVGLGIRRQP